MQKQISAVRVRGWKDTVCVAFASVLFLGYAPVASGTFGSVPAVLVAWWLNQRPFHLLMLAAVVFILGVAASDRVEKLFGRSDPSEVTVDEFVGMLIAYLGHPMTWSSVTIIFIIYRLFDIFKPFPARQCERLPGGLGIMTDDLVAGIYANLAFWLIVLMF
jgi:phosphatidylglycerophosphatase A